MTLFIWPSANSGLATEATLASVLAELGTIDGHIDGLETLVGSTNTKLDTIAGYVDGIETLIGTTNTNTGNTNTAISERLSGSLVPAKYDYIAYTDGGASETFVYKTGGSGGTTQKTIVVTYTDASKAVLVSVAAT